MADRQGVPRVFEMVVDRYLASHDKPLPELYPDQCWEFMAGEFEFRMNGSGKDIGAVPAYTLAVYLNGWPVLLADPGGDVTLTGGGEPGEMEDRIIKALEIANG